MDIHEFQIAADPARPEEPGRAVFLTKGTWEVSLLPDPQGALTAWNAWSGQTTGCGPEPGSCTKGWLNVFHYWHPALVPPDPIRLGDSRRYETPDQALTAFVPQVLDIPRDCPALFYIWDSYHDDKGGLSIRLKRQR